MPGYHLKLKWRDLHSDERCLLCVQMYSDMLKWGSQMQSWGRSEVDRGEIGTLAEGGRMKPETFFNFKFLNVYSFFVFQLSNWRRDWAKESILHDDAYGLIFEAVLSSGKKSRFFACFPVCIANKALLATQKTVSMVEEVPLWLCVCNKNDWERCLLSREVPCWNAPRRTHCCVVSAFEANTAPHVGSLNQHLLPPLSTSPDPAAECWLVLLE